MSDEIGFLERLMTDWRAGVRPLIIADEVRKDDPLHKEIVAFVFVCTDTRTATQFADEATEIRGRLSPPLSESLIKGSHLFGAKPRPELDEFRVFVESAIVKCPIVVRVTTTSQTITRYKTIAPGGIRRETANAVRGFAPVIGRELVPLMNMLKVVATAMKVGEAQVDVLLDRSFNLGLDPGQLGIGEDDIAVFGPGTFNAAAGGSPAAFNCPSSFQLICPPKHSAFRDLLLLPDAVAYRMRPLLPSMADELSRTAFRVDVFPSNVEKELMAALATTSSMSAPVASTSSIPS
jgi:hypothetical protein